MKFSLKNLRNLNFRYLKHLLESGNFGFCGYVNQKSSICRENAKFRRFGIWLIERNLSNLVLVQGRLRMQGEHMRQMWRKFM